MEGLKEIEIYGKKYKYRVADSFDSDAKNLIPFQHNDFTITIFYDGKETRVKKRFFKKSETYECDKPVFYLPYDIDSKNFKHSEDWNIILKEASEKYLISLKEFSVEDPNIKYYT
jgi:hypothetical protein